MLKRKTLKLKISAVSYLNTLPFLYGLRKSPVYNEVDLQLDMPSVCAEKLLSNKIDIGLVPVAILPLMESYHILSDFCIGAEGKVKTVLLLSDVPLNEITEVLLDYQSKTSVNLVKVLAKNHWRINPKWIDAKSGFENNIEGRRAGVIIGDRTFHLNKSYKYQYDLAEEWEKMTGLPFVFACWVSNKKLPQDFIERFNSALELGVNSISESLKASEQQQIPEKVLHSYLSENISYSLNDKKKLAIKHFLDALKSI